MRKVLVLSALLLCWASAVSAQAEAPRDLREGVHYIKLNKAASTRVADVITVTEVFSYGCHACNDFEPYIQSWKTRQAKDVKLTRIPVGFGRHSWELLAKGYVIAEILGVEEEAHVPLMNAVWREGKQMRSLEEMADFYAQHGADKSKYLALDGSFMLNMREKQNSEKLGLYAIKGTPTMIVNDKFKVQTGQAVPNYQAMLMVVDHLVALERAAMAPEAAALESPGEVETAAH